MATDQQAMIECEGLTKRFGTFTAVDQVSFKVGKGSIFGFLGPNGSGKSTVIRMLCGILEPSAGTARIDGHDVVRDTESIKDIIGYMSQKFSLYDELTVDENLIFSGKLYGLHGRELTKRRDELKQMAEVNPPGTRRLDVTCDHVTTALQAMRQMRGVRSATVFGQSMHLLVDESVRRDEIDEKLRSVGISHTEIHEIGPSLEDVFVTLSAKYASEQQKEKAA